jgi:hypothetical protein
MRYTFYAVATIAILFSNLLSAQEKEPKKKKKSFTIELGGNEEKSSHMRHKKSSDSTSDKGLVDSGDEEDSTKTKAFNAWEVMLDLGVNTIRDNTNYSDPAVKNYLNVTASRQNASLFDLRTAKSINVNIYPWMVKFRALKTAGQRIYISSGVGLQLYNFRYENPLTYTRNPSGVILDSLTFTKDKLALDYVNVPLFFTFKTKLHKGAWLVYGAGITEGYRLDSWTKQKTDARGKVKIHDAFGLADFNTCLSAEIGVDGIVRFFASYQLTSLYQNGLDQHPLSIGLRLIGM